MRAGVASGSAEQPTERPRFIMPFSRASGVTSMPLTLKLTGYAVVDADVGEVTVDVVVDVNI